MGGFFIRSCLEAGLCVVLQVWVEDHAPFSQEALEGVLVFERLCWTIVRKVHKRLSSRNLQLGRCGFLSHLAKKIVVVSNQYGRMKETSRRLMQIDSSVVLRRAPPVSKGGFLLLTSCSGVPRQ